MILIYSFILLILNLFYIEKVIYDIFSYVDLKKIVNRFLIKIIYYFKLLGLKIIKNREKRKGNEMC